MISIKASNINKTFNKNGNKVKALAHFNVDIP